MKILELKGRLLKLKIFWLAQQKVRDGRKNNL